jgi:hypothetical protein
MTIKLQRLPTTTHGTFGILLVSGEPTFTTLEPIIPVIPPGTYGCTRRWSPRFSTEVFELLNVPGHTDIEIHIGNTIEDTHGCILIGLIMDLETNRVSRSAIAFGKFMATFDQGFELEIVGD